MVTLRVSHVLAIIAVEFSTRALLDLANDFGHLVGFGVTLHLPKAGFGPAQDLQSLVALSVRRQDLAEPFADDADAFEPADPVDDAVGLGDARRSLGDIAPLQFELRDVPQRSRLTVKVTELAVLLQPSRL